MTERPQNVCMTFQLQVDKSFLSNLRTSQPLAFTNPWKEKLKRIHDAEITRHLHTTTCPK